MHLLFLGFAGCFSGESRSYDDFLLDSDVPAVDTDSSARQCSDPSGPPRRVRFDNPTPDAVQLWYVREDCTSDLITELDSQESVEHDTAPGDVWRFRIEGGPFLQEVVIDEVGLLVEFSP